MQANLRKVLKWECSFLTRGFHRSARGSHMCCSWRNLPQCQRSLSVMKLTIDHLFPSKSCQAVFSSVVSLWVQAAYQSRIYSHDSLSATWQTCVVAAGVRVEVLRNGLGLAGQRRHACCAVRGPSIIHCQKEVKHLQLLLSTLLIYPATTVLLSGWFPLTSYNCLWVKWHSLRVPYLHFLARQWSIWCTAQHIFIPSLKTIYHDFQSVICNKIVPGKVTVRFRTPASKSSYWISLHYF